MSQTDTAQLQTPEPFHPPEYDYSTLVSAPASHKLSPTLLSLHHSFGYDLLRRCNLYVLDHDTVMYISGNLVHFLTLSSGAMAYLRSASGLGIGSLAVHPSRQYIAVAEKGQMPDINIFTYPALRLHRVLRGGTEMAYAQLTFSSGEGLKIASVGGSPDFMLTVWDWKCEAIVLRTKAFSQDIFRVTFSPENDGILTTSGIGHIRFWKMATTFTGLKLQGDIGKFGKREISDVSGYAEFPDGKVLSGTEWGNLLLWEGDLVKVELCRKGQKPCHVGNIEFVFLDEGEIITGGSDGIIRIWDFEQIDQADVIDDNDLIEIMPLQEVKLATRTGASVKHLAKLNHPDTPTYWVVQDNKGSIWRVDLQVSHTHKPPERLYTFHSGAITGLDVSGNSLHAVTCGVDGRVRLYCVESKRFLGRTTFNMPATCVVWCPYWFDSSGLSVIAGFADGIIRLLHITDEDGQSPNSTEEIAEDSSFTLKQVLKPHSKPLTAILLGNSSSNLNLITAAEDSIFFMLKGEEGSKDDDFIPLGFMPVDSPVVNLAWAPHNSTNRFTVLASLKNASVLLISVPVRGEFDISKSYHLTGVSHQIFRFKSVKYDMLKAARDTELEAERAKKLKKEEDQESTSSLPSHEQETELDPYADIPAPPDLPSPILHAFYHGRSSNFWLCMDTYDCEYLYECWISSEGPDPEGDRPLKVIPVPRIFGSIQPITSLSYTRDKEHILIGTSNGQIQVHKINVNGNLSLDQFWAIPMGDPDSKVNRVCTTYDDQYILATTQDGNFFSFKLEDRNVSSQQQQETPGSADIDITPAKDIEDPKHYSLEEARQRAENDRKLKLAEEQKKQVLAQVNRLRKQFKQFQTQNSNLPPHIQIPGIDFIMDKQAAEDFNRETAENLKIVELQQQWLREKYDIGYDKLFTRYKVQLQCDSIVVYSFRSDDVMTRTLRCLKRTARDDELLSDVRAVTSESLRYSSRMLPSSNLHVFEDKSTPVAKRVSIKHEADLEKMSKGELRRFQRKKRVNEWAQLVSEKPMDGYQHPEDIALLLDAETNMGDFKLKTSDDYTVPEELRMNATKKRMQLVLLRQAIQFGSDLFNSKVIELRDEKVQLIDRFASCLSRLKEIQTFLPRDELIPPPKLPILRPEEIPESLLELTETDLLRFEKDYQKKLEARAKAKQAGDEFGGFGGFGAAAPADMGDEELESSSEGQSSEKGSLTELTADLEEVNGRKNTRTPGELVLYNEMMMRLRYERDSLLREIETSKRDFDSKVIFLSNFKTILDTQIKLSDLKHILLFEEYLLLKDFEKREQSFISKLKEKQRDRLEMQEKLNKLKEQIESKQNLVHHAHDNLKELEEDFQKEIANNKFAEFLLRVFKKKIKRIKQVEKKEEGESSDEQSDSDLESDISSEEGSVDIKEKIFDDSTCPSGCQVHLFEKACEMRETRMDLEELLNEDKKSLDLLKKDSDNSVKKAKVMDNAVKNAKSDLENFQLEKQHRLNELEVLVLLRISQILITKPNSDPPSNLKTALVFSERNLNRLNLRAGEIREEQIDLRRQRKELETKKLRLTNDKKTMFARVQDLENQVDEIMMLKFGRKVDLDFFDPVEPSKNVLELHEQIALFEKQARHELTAKQEEIEQKKNTLDEVLQLNTRKLRSLTQLLGKMSENETKLETGEKQLGSEFQSPESHLTSDNAEIANLVKMQAIQIEGLNREIRVLSLKTGHVPPPRPPSIAQSHFTKQTQN